MKFLKLCYYRSAYEPRALEILTELLDSGVDVDVKATYNATGLCLICLTNYTPSGVDILRLLLEVINFLIICVLDKKNDASMLARSGSEHSNRCWLFSLTPISLGKPDGNAATDGVVADRAWRRRECQTRE